MNDITIFTDDNIAILRENTSKLELHKHNINLYNNVIDIINICRELELFNIWITPYSELSGKFTKTYFDVLTNNSEYGCKGTKFNADNYCSFTRLYRKDGLKDIFVTIPEYNYLWRFNEYKDVSPNDLAVMLYQLRDKLNIQLYNSPTAIGINLLKSTINNDNIHWLKSSNFEIGDIPIASNLVWKTNLPIKHKKYLHAYDKKGAFLSSYQSTLLGSGNPNHYNDSIIFDDKKIGVWNIESISGTSIYNGETLPLPYNNYSINNWLWTPEIKIATKLGYKFIIKEAYIWEESHYIFRIWAKMLSDSRNELNKIYLENNKHGNYMAYNAIKNIYTTTGGRLAHRDNNYTNKDIYQRFDWFSMIVSDTKLKVLYEINKHVQLGYYPIMVLTDCLYYLSDEKDYRKAIPIMENEHKLGGYKHKYSVEWCLVEKQFSELSENKLGELLNNLERQGKTF